nr:MAG TPA: antitoxin [Caudoviricetes sp.]
MSEKKYIHQENWGKKNGYKSISFKLKESTAQEFKDTCKRLGVSQGATLLDFMENFIKKNKENL